MTGPRFTVLVTDNVTESGLGPLLDDDRFEVVKIDDSADPAFAPALATAIDRVVADQALSNALATAGRATFEFNFTEAAVVRRYLNFFEKVAA